VERICKNLNISAVALTDKGMRTGSILKRKINGQISLSRCGENNLDAWIYINFSSADALIFISPVEAAVKAVSPFVHMPNIPAIVVIDELGKFAVPILSSTYCDADNLVRTIADIIGAIPIVSSSADNENCFCIEEWAESAGLRISNPDTAKNVAFKLLSGSIIHYDSVFPILGTPPAGFVESSPSDISDFSITYLSSVPENTLHLVPPVLTLGIDCEKGTNCKSIQTAFENFMEKCGCHPLALRNVCSIDTNTSEQGLLEFCANIGIPFRTFSAYELSNAPDRFSAPEVRSSDGGIDNVCERSAVLGSGGTLFVRKMSIGTVSMALAISEPK